MPAHLTNPLLHQALLLARSGYPIMPLFEPTARGCSCGNPDCTRAGKRPRTAHGVHDATTDSETITAWWTHWPKANLALATGSRSGCFVLDVDGPEGFATLATLAGAGSPVPDAAKVLTGRGAHFYFRLDGLEVRNVSLGPSLDLRGDGGYVVGPSSLHRSGKRYRHAEWGRIRPSLIPAKPPHWLQALILSKPSASTAVVGAEAERARADEAARCW